jgi:hypothetical protein
VTLHLKAAIMKDLNIETPTNHLVSQVIWLFWSTSLMEISWLGCREYSSKKKLHHMNIEVLKVKWKEKKIKAQ